MDRPGLQTEPSEKLPLFESSHQFIDYLRVRLIPDLHLSGHHNTAKDFEEAIYWIQHEISGQG